MKVYRHGDVLIRQVDEIPADAVRKAKDKRGLVLAEGEVTGHHHRIADTSMGQLLVSPADAEDMRMWLSLSVEAPLVHEEHHTLTLPPGNYEVMIQKEYEPEGIRNVMD